MRDEGSEDSTGRSPAGLRIIVEASPSTPALTQQVVWGKSLLPPASASFLKTGLGLLVSLAS